MDERKNWFEITTYPADPSRIEMRRLSDEEAAQAAAEQLAIRLLAAGFGGAHIEVERFINQFSQHDLGSVYIDTFVEGPTQPDPKVEARRRSKEDLRLKRKNMMKRGGRI